MANEKPQDKRKHQNPKETNKTGTNLKAKYYETVSGILDKKAKI